MLKKYLAICDSELPYVEAFIDYMGRQRSIGYDYVGFSSIEELLCFSEGQHISILLISKDLYNEALKDLNATVLYISEVKEDTGDDCVFKYQKISDFINEISTKCNSELIGVKGKNILTGDADIIGVYSPIGRSGKSILSITLAGIISRSSRVLYINLEAMCGFEWAYGKPGEWDLSDIMYELKNGRLTTDSLDGAIKNNGYFDFIPPAALAMDIRLMEYAHMAELLQLIGQLNRYRYIIVDLNELVDDYLRLLADCKSIYMPLVEDDISIIKLRRFLQLLDSRQNTVDKEKIIPLVLPRCDEDIVTIDGIDRLFWSNFGMYVKEILQEGDL